MMYDELYQAWKYETTEYTLGTLPRDFYENITRYLHKIKEENSLPDNKSLKTILLDKEVVNVKHMLGELLWARYKKLVKFTTQTQKLSMDLLAFEEAQIFESFVPFTKAYQKFVKSLLQGQTRQSRQEIRKRITLRFSKEIPQIMGVDMKPYGPFAVEDIAALPVQNAKIIVKQNLAVIVDVV
jgi:DNA replication initiation complex subunit (GINS family)